MPRSYRLSKSRTTSSTYARSPDDRDFPIRTSYDQLRTPEGRQLLKEQLTGAFPETARKTSQDFPTARNMPVKGFPPRGSNVEVGSNPGAKLSSSTIDSVGSKRLSIFAEAQNKAIDIEQAINLLQELKKTASPDELVALHRALLPTKDNVPSPRQDSVEFPSPNWQRKSAAIPPGLATRAGGALDLLQKPSDCVEPKKFKLRQKGAWSEPESQTPDSSLAALDLAKDKAVQASGRVSTPTDLEFPQAGIYRHGTLRVTNGAASPDPSMRAVSRGGLPADNDQYVQPPPTEYFPALEQQPDVPRENKGKMDLIRTKPSVDSMVTHDGSLTAKRRHNAKTWQETSPRSPPHSMIRPSAPARAHTEPVILRDEEDANTVPSPELSTLARFQQRHSQNASASQTSAEYSSTCQISASPFAGNTLLNFAARLSTVFDSENDDEPTYGTPADALAMLVGQADDAQTSSPAGATRDTPSQEQRRTPPSVRSTQRPRPQKTDSGYASDTSFRNANHHTPQDRAAYKPSVTTEDSLGEDHEPHENAGKSSSDGTRSLYTFEEILKSPAILDKAASSKPQKSKSKMSLLSLHSLKSEKRNSVQSTIPGKADDTLSQSPSSPAQQPDQSGKLQKKLQKPMPDALKKQRSEEKKKLKETKAQAELSTVPEGLPATQVRRVRDEVPGNTDFREGFEDEQPAELSADPPESKWPLFSRSRSKGRSRGRSNSVRQNPGELPGTPETHRSWSISGRRSKSGSRTRSQSAKRSSVEIIMGSCVSASPEDRPVTPGEENVPAYTDFGSVARTLGGGSYDISTNMAKRATAPVPSAVQHSVQSPFAISTGLIKTKSRGMTPEMASELARMKSRDFAPQDLQHAQDRPRVAVPKHTKSKSRSKASTVSERRVEDSFPEWQSKPVASFPAPAPGANRPYSLYAESIPPLPELPADVVMKAHRAEEMIAKKSSKESARSTPNASARNSADMGQQRPTSAKKSRSTSRARTQQEPSLPIESSTPGGQVACTQDGNVVHAQLKPSEDQVETRDMRQDEAAAHEQSTSPGRDSQHAGWPGWEQQAALWRERRQSMIVQFGKPEDHDTLPQADSPPLSRKASAVALNKSPSIVVSRYITPLASESAARANAGPQPPNPATQHAEAYRGLIGDDKENRPAQQDIPRTDSAVSSASSNATFVTVKSWDPRPAKQSGPRSNSSVSTSTHTTTVTTTTTFSARPRTSPAQRARTASGRFVAYSPTQAVAAEQTRADGSPKKPNVSGLRLSGGNVEAASLVWMDGSANSSTTSLGTPCATRRPKKSEGSLHDRYSGGLGYGWDRVSGFGGSAGTRTSGSEGNRKSVHMSEQFGIDLSDVPVFLQRRAE